MWFADMEYMTGFKEEYYLPVWVLRGTFYGEDIYGKEVSAQGTITLPAVK